MSTNPEDLAKRAVLANPRLLESTEPLAANVANISDEPENNPTYRALRHFWHPVFYADELTDRPMQVTLFNEKICIVRLDEKLVAFEDRCCHKGAALSLGEIKREGSTLQCHYHGWEYDNEGEIVRIPAREEIAGRVRRSLKKYNVTEASGLIWICVEDEPKFSVPEFPELNDPEFKVIKGEPYDWRTSTPRRLENFVDFAHFAFVHPDSIGDPEHARVEAVDIWREGPVLRFDRSGIPEPSTPDKKKLMGLEDMAYVEPVNTYHVTMPHTVHLKREFPRGARYILFMSTSPVTATQARSFWFLVRDFGTEDKHDDFFMKYEQHVLSQDKPIIESQTPVQMHVAGELARQEMPVPKSDIVSVEYRRWLNELTQELADE